MSLHYVLFHTRSFSASQATVEMGWGYLRKQLREFTLNTQVWCQLESRGLVRFLQETAVQSKPSGCSVGFEEIHLSIMSWACLEKTRLILEGSMWPEPSIMAIGPTPN